MEGAGAKPLPLEEGPEVDCRGMIPRAVEQVFAAALSLKDQGWEVRKHSSQSHYETGPFHPP